MPKRTVGKVLEHFDYVRTTKSGKYDISGCKYCGDKFSRRAVGTDLLKAHLAGTSVPCKRVPDYVRQAFSTSSNPDSSMTTVAGASGSQVQTTLGCSVSPALQEQAAIDVALWVYGCGVSFSAIDNELFKAAMRSVARAGVVFKPPTRWQLARTLLDKVYLQIKNLVQQQINKNRKYGFSICSDGWSDVNSHPLLNFMVMMASGQFFLGAIDASGETKSGEYISTAMNRYIRDLGHDDVVCVVTDNASNCTSAGELIEIEYPHVTWLGCIPHCLNLLMGDIGKLAWVSRVVNLVSKVTSTIRNAPRLKNIFQARSDLELMTYPETRFAYALLMLERFQKVKSSLVDTVTSSDWELYKTRQRGPRKIELSDIQALVQETSHEGIAMWRGVGVVIAIMTPIMCVLRKADAEQPCMGIIHQCLLDMRSSIAEIKLHPNRNECEKRRAEVLQLVNNRNDFLHRPIYAAADAMSPTSLSKSISSTAEDDLDTVLMQLCPANSTLTDLKREWGEFREYDGPGAAEAETAPPHEWWSAHGRKWPTLKPIAMKIFAQCPSSSPSERNWSAYSFVHSRIRNRLTQARAEKLVYVFHNLRSLRHISVSEADKLNRLEADAQAAMQMFEDESEDEIDDE